MKYLKKLSILLMVLVVLSMGAGAFAVNTVNTNKTIQNSTTKIINNTFKNKTRTLYVSTNGSDNNDGLTPTKAKRKIQSAINNAKYGDTIIVARGKYKENLLINKDITLMGDTQNNTIIDGKQITCITIPNKRIVTITRLTLQKGRIGICNHGNLTIINSTVHQNNAPKGGGIYNDGNLFLKDSLIANNTSEDGGGIYNENTLNIYNSQISNNNESGIKNNGILNMNNSLISYNIDGGIMNNNNLNVINSSITNNKAGENYGGGIFNWYDGRITLTNSTVNNNTSKYSGGGIRNTGAVSIYNTQINYNFAYSGGGLLNEGTLILNNSTVMKNKAIMVGGIDNWRSLTIIASNITANKGTLSGGIRNHEGELVSFHRDQESVIKDNQPNDVDGEPWGFFSKL